MIAQQASLAFSGNIPANYDTHLGPLFFEPFATVVAERVRQLRPETLLEVACGTGRLTQHLPGVLPAGATVLASDINPAMLAYARETLKNHGNIRWDVVDAVSLPYQDGAFDLILSQFGVMFYSDRTKAFAEVFRTVKSGGAFVFTAWDKLEHNPAAQLTDETLRHFFPIDTPAFYQVPFSYHDEHRIRYDLAQAGFEQVRTETLTLTGDADTAENAAKGLLEGTPVHTAIVERDEALLLPLRRELAEALTLKFGPTQLAGTPTGAACCGN